jgi:hypothetical protein
MRRFINAILGSRMAAICCGILLFVVLQPGVWFAWIVALIVLVTGDSLAPMNSLQLVVSKSLHMGMELVAAGVATLVTLLVSGTGGRLSAAITALVLLVLLAAFYWYWPQIRLSAMHFGSLGFRLLWVGAL